jgi:hypothetical protein
MVSGQNFQPRFRRSLRPVPGAFLRFSSVERTVPISSTVYGVVIGISFNGYRLSVSLKIRLKTSSCVHACQSQFRGDRPHCLDTERDVLIEINTQVSRAINNVLAIDAAREGPIFHLAADRPSVYLG